MKRSLLSIIVIAAAFLVAGGGARRPLHPPPAQAVSAPLQMTILGDSYASGEGDRPFYPGTDVWSTGCGIGSPVGVCDLCHRSVQAWGAVTYRALTGIDVTASTPSFHMLACSGDKIAEVLFNPNPKYPNEPAQLPQMEALPAQDVAALTLSGNDAAFANIIEVCAVVAHCDEKYDTIHGGTLLNQITGLEPQLAAALSQIAAVARAKNPDVRVILVGYPALFPPDASYCTQSHVLFDGEEIRWFRTIADTFQTMEQQAADAAGVEQVDEETAFRGHELCVASGSNLAVVPINFGDFFDPQRRPLEMHPTPFGQQLLAQRVIAQIKSAPSSGTRTIVADGSVPGANEEFRLQPLNESGARIGPTQITTGAASASPDGTEYAALGTEGEPAATIYTVAGERLVDQQQLLGGLTGPVFAWAPGGHDYVAVTPDGCLTWDAGTSRSRRVVCATKSTGRPLSLTFTPDGTGIVWVGNLGLTSAFPIQPDTLIYTDVASGRSRTLQPAVDAAIGDVALSADGDQVAYTATPSPDQPNPPSNVYTVTVSGGVPKLLDPAVRGHTHTPVWVGASVVYSRVTGRDSLGEPTAQVYESTPGAEPRQLTELPTDIGHVTAEPVTALPDGRSVIITQVGEDTCTSYLLDTVTRRAQPLINASSGNDSPISGVSADGAYALIVGGDSCGDGGGEPGGLPIIWAPLHGGGAHIIARSYGASLANSLPVVTVP
jgi:predicted small lipoprotein YifL